MRSLDPSTQLFNYNRYIINSTEMEQSFLVILQYYIKTVYSSAFTKIYKNHLKKYYLGTSLVECSVLKKLMF